VSTIMENLDPSTEPIDFELINRVLDNAETALLGIAVDHRITGARVERWRWDQPEVVMSWEFGRGPERRGKNLRVSVRAVGGHRLVCALESNVWHDRTWTDGALLRNWQHFVGSSLDIGDPGKNPEEETKAFRDLLEPLYENVAKWNPNRLSQATLIYPDGHTEMVSLSQTLRHVG
jgi:hypothetical protein